MNESLIGMSVHEPLLSVMCHCLQLLATKKQSRPTPIFSIFFALLHLILLHRPDRTKRRSAQTMATRLIAPSCKRLIIRHRPSHNTLLLKNFQGLHNIRALSTTTTTTPASVPSASTKDDQEKVNDTSLSSKKRNWRIAKKLGRHIWPT